jgi:hypothetical protein
MNEHLKEISAQLEPGHHAVVLLDQAGWHTSATLHTPANLTLLPPPGKAPALKPAENLWQFAPHLQELRRNFRPLLRCLGQALAHPIGLTDWAHRY